MICRILVVLALLLVVPAESHALVMCGPKKPDGTVREGASIKLRSACKPNEVQVDPVALGLQGPQGPPGPSGMDGADGATGPTGATGPGVFAVDANGVPIGPVFSGVDGQPEFDQLVAVATTSVDGLSHPVTCPAFFGPVET